VKVSVLTALLLSGAACAQAAQPPAGMINTYDLAEYAGQLYGLPPHLMAALVRQESVGNPYALSPVGAMGLTQLMPGTAREMGVNNPWDAWQSALGGAKYLRQQLLTFRRLDLALAAYNAGAGNVRKYGGIPPFTETLGYVNSVMNYYNGYVAGAAPQAFNTPLSSGGAQPPAASRKSAAAVSSPQGGKVPPVSSAAPTQAALVAPTVVTPTPVAQATRSQAPAPAQSGIPQTQRQAFTLNSTPLTSPSQGTVGPAAGRFSMITSPLMTTSVPDGQDSDQP